MEEKEVYEDLDAWEKDILDEYLTPKEEEDPKAKGAKAKKGKKKWLILMLLLIFNNYNFILSFLSNL